MTSLLLALALAAPANAATALSPESDRNLLEGIDMMYALDIEGARKNFQAVLLAEPEHPAGPMLLGGLYWLQYTQSFDIEEGGDVEDKFLFYTEEAINRANLRLKKNPNDAEAYMYLGGAWGLRGRWKVLERSWLKAARLGLKAYRYLEKTVKLDPSLSDAYLGLGIYDYYSETLPSVLRWLSAFVIKGDKARGLRYITNTIQNGKYSRTEAKLFLIGIYNTQEKRYDEALKMIRDLRREKPTNLYFGVLEVIALMHLRNWDAAAQEGDRLLIDLLNQSAGPATAYMEPSLFYMYVGEAYQGLGNQERAIDYFTHGAATARDPRRATATYCLLRRAQSLDLLGRRAEAVKDYAAVTRRRDYWDSAPKARKGLQSPITREELLRQLAE